MSWNEEKALEQLARAEERLRKARAEREKEEEKLKALQEKIEFEKRNPLYYKGYYSNIDDYMVREKDGTYRHVRDGWEKRYIKFAYSPKKYLIIPAAIALYFALVAIIPILAKMTA